jgi:protein-L-isoaspartate(D-aspartate) O-methyltransferase
LARVRREAVVGKGPWYFPSPESWLAGGSHFRLSDSADPRLVYRNLAIAFDPSRDLTNGHPGKVASWIDALALQPGARVLHVGCGTGYYTAILAELVGPDGRVIAVEVDRDLVRRARRCLRDYRNVELRFGDATTMEPGPIDAFLVSAGLLHVPRLWLDRLRAGGRAILPLTFAIEGTSLTKGAAFCLVREAHGFSATSHSFALIYGDVNRRDLALNEALHRQYQAGTWPDVRSLRRDPHAPDPSCWFHTHECCFSTRPVEPSSSD